jgi:hypothetical protein
VAPPVSRDVAAANQCAGAGAGLAFCYSTFKIAGSAGAAQRESVGRQDRLSSQPGPVGAYALAIPDVKADYSQPEGSQMGKGINVGNFKWNYVTSRVLGASQKPEPTSLQSMDAHCLECDARWSAKKANDTEPGYFVPALGHFIITCPNCTQQVTHENPAPAS